MSETLDLRPADRVNLAGEEDTGRGHLSHSSISTQLNCLKRWDWHYNQRLQLIEGPRALGLGKAFQKSIELQDPEAGVRMLEEAAPVPRSQEAEDRLAIESAMVRGGSKLYMERWPAPNNEAREFHYRVRLRSPWTGRPSMTFDLLGYADGVEDFGDYLELTENKFVGDISALGVRKLPLDRQVGLACYGLWRATGKPVRQVRYRYVRKLSIKPKKGRENKAGVRVGAETIAEYCARVEADYADPERRDFYSHEEVLFREPKDLLLLEAELWDWAEQLRNAKARDFFSRNTSHCHDYGGCPFIPLCVGDPDAMSLYQVRPEREIEEEAKAK